MFVWCSDLPCRPRTGQLSAWIIIEPRRDKTNKMTVCSVKTQISLGIRPVWSVFAVCMKKYWALSYPLSAQRRLTRQGGCPGWSESSLGAQPFCWFCHVVAHMLHWVLCWLLILEAAQEQRVKLATCHIHTMSLWLKILKGDWHKTSKDDICFSGLP